MQIFRFGPTLGQSISQYESRNFVLARLLRLDETAVLSLVYLEPGGVIGHHAAIGDQLFLVLLGQGDVRGAAGNWQTVQPGQAVFWCDGEHHETRTEQGLTAIMVEGNRVDPTIYLQLMLDENITR